MLKVLQSGWMPVGDLPDFNPTVGLGKKFNKANSNAVYIGGMPVGMTATGLVCGGQAGQCVVTASILSGAAGISNLFGLLVNNITVDIRRGSQAKTSTDIGDALPAVQLLPAYVQLFKGVTNDVNDAFPPFLEGDTWAINDMLYVEANATATLNGRLTNTTGAPNTASIGRVLKAPASVTDTMIALFWNVPGAQDIT